MGWVGPEQTTVLVPESPASMGRRHKELVVSSVAMGVVDDARRGFPTPVGPTVLLAGVQNRPLNTTAPSTTNLPAPAHPLSIGLGTTLPRLALSCPSDVITGCLGPTSLVEVCRRRVGHPLRQPRHLRLRVDLVIESGPTGPTRTPRTNNTAGAGTEVMTVVAQARAERWAAATAIYVPTRHQNLWTSVGL